MKTNVVIHLIALAILTQPAIAGKDSPRLATTRPAAARPMKPSQPAAAPRGFKVQSKPSKGLANHPAITGTKAADTHRFAKAPSALPASRNILPKPLSGIDAGKADALRNGREMSNGLNAMNELRHSGLRDNLPEGLKNPLETNNSGGPSGPADPRTPSTGYARTPMAPAHTSPWSGGGLTDVRGGSDGSRKGTPASADDLTRSTQRVTESSSRLTFGSGSQSTASGPVRVTRDEESGEFVATQTGTDSNGNQTRVDVIENTDDDGHVTGTTEIVTRSDGESASQRTIIRDSSGAILSDKTEKTNQGTRSIDRSTGDIATGGPVGPGAAAVTGLVPVDLLRQPTGNEQSGGTGGTFTVDQMTGGRQVRPSGGEANTGIGGNQNPVPVNRDASIVNPGPNGTGGGDLPD